MVKCPRCGRSVATVVDWYDQPSGMRRRPGVRRYAPHLYPIGWWKSNGGVVDDNDTWLWWCLKSGGVVERRDYEKTQNV